MSFLEEVQVKLFLFALWVAVGMCAHDLDETLSQIQGMISRKEKGAYLCFGRADIDVASGKGGDFWNQVEMQELLGLDEPHVLKSRFLPYTALNGHRPEDAWAAGLFRRHESTWEGCYAPIAPAVLSTGTREKCAAFFRFLQSQSVVVIGDVPLETTRLLFGQNALSVPTAELKLSRNYQVVILATEDKLSIKKWLDEDAVFVLDLSGLTEALHGWSKQTWVRWLKPSDRFKIFYTSALIPHKFEERKEEYIKCLRLLKRMGLEERIYIVESGPFTPRSFFEDYCNKVFYANTNDPSFVNKGVNEVKASLAAFDYYSFDDEDMIVKLTGRYLFNETNFLHLIGEHPEVDAFASYLPDRKRGVNSGCYAMRYKYYKRFLQGLNLQRMEEKLIDIEFEIEQFLQKIALEGVHVMHIEKMGITADVGNSGDIQQW